MNELQNQLEYFQELQQCDDLPVTASEMVSLIRDLQLTFALYNGDVAAFEMGWKKAEVSVVEITTFIQKLHEQGFTLDRTVSGGNKSVTDAVREALEATWKIHRED